MSNKDSYNFGGMALFVISMIVTMVYFAYVLVVNPGPIDTGLYEAQVKFSKSDNDTRYEQWKAVTEENVQYGLKLYGVNCVGCHMQTGKDIIQERFAAGSLKRGQKPLEIYTAIRKGWDGQHRMDYVPEREKWALVAYLRSNMKNAPDDSSSEWSDYLKKGRY